MKKIVTTTYYSWLGLSLIIAIYFVATGFELAWLGVLMASLPPLVNLYWRFDDGRSPSTKAKYPRLSLCVLGGLAWVMLTVTELRLPLWLTLGCIAGFLLHSYWVDGARSRFVP